MSALAPPQQHGSPAGRHFADEDYNLRLEIDAKGCKLTDGEIDQMRDDLKTLSKLTADMPVSDLHVTVAHFEHSGEYHVKTTLVTPGRQIFTGEHDTVVHPAYQRCVRKLVRKLRDYKDRMETHDGERGKLAEHTRHELNPDYLPNIDAVNAAVDGGDYQAFRREMAGFEGPLRDRVGRWVERYPDVDEFVGENLPIAEIMEETFLSAFERFPEWPPTMRLGDWLESLVDPAIRNLLRHPDEELEAVSFARTLREMDTSEVHTGPGGSNPDADDPTNAEPGHRHVGGTAVAPLPDAPR